MRLKLLSGSAVRAWTSCEFISKELHIPKVTLMLTLEPTHWSRPAGTICPVLSPDSLRSLPASRTQGRVHRARKSGLNSGPHTPRGPVAARVSFAFLPAWCNLERARSPSCHRAVWHIAFAWSGVWGSWRLQTPERSESKRSSPRARQVTLSQT